MTLGSNTWGLGKPLPIGSPVCLMCRVPEEPEKDVQFHVDNSRVKQAPEHLSSEAVEAEVV